MSTVNAEMIEAFGASTKVVALDISSGKLHRDFIYHLVKTARAVSVFPRMALARLRGARTFYGSVDDGFGGVWTAVFAAFARILGYRTYLHHHSFRYIVERTRMMAGVTRLAGRSATHILLCPAMEAAFRGLYPSVRNTIVVPNPVPVPADDAPPSPIARSFTIGLLANLTVEKGLTDFVTILTLARASGADIRGILAGPVPDIEARRVLDRAIEQTPGLRWIGAVSGAAKERFFADVDLFVFPTRYRTEAYPLVLMEAAVRGVAIVAPDRGCIGSFGALASATIVPLDVDFVQEAVAKIAAQVKLRDHHGSTRTQIAREGRALNDRNRIARNALIARVTTRVE